MERPSLRLPAPVMYSFPVGALMDIPTGVYLKGTHDQRVLLGGISNITGYVGPGNAGKTTIMRFAVLSAISRIFPAVDDTFYVSYDTEINTHEDRNSKLAANFDSLKNEDIIYRGVWQITNKAVYPGNEFWDETKKNLKAKTEDKKAKLWETAFLDRDRISPMKVTTPWFYDIDSLSQFITADVEKMADTTELGEKEGNTIFMRQGLAKARMLMEMPQVAGRNFSFFMFTAHIGKEIIIPSGPMAPMPKKQLDGVPNGEIIKGVSNNFFYLLHNCWYITGSRAYLHKEKRSPYYPYNQGEEVEGDLDLRVTSLRQLRGKNGGSGFTINIVWSQKDGVDPTLTEFDYIKEDNYGISGNAVTYHLDLYPDVNLMRTTIRTKIREDSRIRRAIEITSQMAQIVQYHRDLRDYIIPPGELREALSLKGYDWDWLLENTRSWHTLDDEKQPLYPFSTLDLCRAAKGEYHPYWLEADCKTVKPFYQKLKEKQ